MSELQTLAPVDCEVAIYECADPITEAYRAAVGFARGAGFTRQLVTRAEYAESGSSASRRKFREGRPHESEKEKPREGVKAKGKQKEDDRSQASANKATRTRRATLSATARRR